LSAAAGATGTARGPGGLPPRRPWNQRRIVLGVTGGIAAYKTVQIARDLTLLGASVDVVLTHAATEFVGAITFEALTGRPAHTCFAGGNGALDHIRIAREADVVCVAPATADFLARAAAGLADDLLTTLLLATRAPVLLCPAMNDGMWAHPLTGANVERLRTVANYSIVGPATGHLAFDEGAGAGRMEDGQTIIEHIGRALEPENPLRGRRIVVTAGPTREPLDPVRVLSNRSSGRMGFAIAAAAWRRGAEVTLISGPATAPLPVGPRIVRVETADEMAAAVRAAIADADALAMAAAPADFRPATVADQKMKKRDRPDSVPLASAPDILMSTRDARPAGMVAVGFALETTDGRASARDKLKSKDLDLIVLNPALEPGAGFDVDTNRVVLIGRDGDETELPLQLKSDVAEAILDRIAAFLAAR
jgi:phosphopantothenoylcysteine decarboxylase/phosphopantothenate--cysteine ligase